MARRATVAAAVAAAAVGAGGLVWAVQSREYKSGVEWPEPKVVDPGPPPAGPANVPADAVVLLGPDGKDPGKWKEPDAWAAEDGYAVMKAKGGATTADEFGDCQLHAEFATPEKVEGAGQGRGNSGIYFMGKYEVQILDSWNNPTYFDGQCGAIYKQTPPLVNASRKPGEWQTYDVVFRAPRFDANGRVTTPAALTVFHNGVLIQNHFELHGGTFYDRPAAYSKHPDRLPLHVQYHGNPVKFRNVWVREVPPMVGKKPDQAVPGERSDR